MSGISNDLTPHQVALVLRHISGVLEQNEGFRSLPPEEQRRVRENTRRIAEALENGPDEVDDGDPFAIRFGGLGDAWADPYAFSLGPRWGASRSPETVGAAALAGARATGAFVREVDFPAFVSELVQGTFRALVQSSIEQMKAYAELVQSVVMSTNEFRERNVSPNQGIDHLMARYPNLFQMGIGSSGPRLEVKKGADSGPLPDFASELGLSEPVTSLDSSTIQEKLIPAARDDLARGRQRMLATMVLMGINRIIVTDGKIHAKVRFDVTTKEASRTQGMAASYDHVGTTVVRTESGDVQVASNPNAEPAGGMSIARQAATGAVTTSTPDIRLTSMRQFEGQQTMTAEGSMAGEVSINFRSETFPLDQMVNSEQLVRLEETRKPRAPTPPKAP